jgi:hypothetical protein
VLGIAAVEATAREELRRGSRLPDLGVGIAELLCPDEAAEHERHEDEGKPTDDCQLAVPCAPVAHARDQVDGGAVGRAVGGRHRSLLDRWSARAFSRMREAVRATWDHRRTGGARSEIPICSRFSC